MTPDEMAAELRRNGLGAAEQFLDQLVELAEGHEVLDLLNVAERALNDGYRDREMILENLIEDVRRVLARKS